MNRSLLLGLTLSFVSISSPALSLTNVIWDEGVDGDLSTNPLAPTPLTFGVGNNEIIGSVQSPNDTRDYITFTIEAGQTLQSILLLQYEDSNTGGPASRGFNAINQGTTSFIPNGGTAGQFLGGAHLDPLPPGTDLLPILAGAPQAGTGFGVPLGPGDYSYLIQQTGPELSGYTLDFVVVPEPLTILGAGTAAGFGTFFKHKFNKRKKKEKKG